MDFRKMRAIKNTFDRLFELFTDKELLEIAYFLNRVLDRLEPEKEVE